MSLVHHAIQSPYHSFTLPSIPTYHVIHSPCHPVRIMVHTINLPCHPFTVLASHHDIQALSHNITPRWQNLRSLTRKRSLSCWRRPWRGSHLGLHPLTLPHSTAFNNLPYSFSSFDLFVLKTSKLYFCCVYFLLILQILCKFMRSWEKTKNKNIATIHFI